MKLRYLRDAAAFGGWLRRIVATQCNRRLRKSRIEIDEERNVGLGPEHDWSSHGADAFGLMCVAYEPPSEMKIPARRMDWVV
jgi:phage terminase large subunit